MLATTDVAFFDHHKGGNLTACAAALGENDPAPFQQQQQTVDALGHPHPGLLGRGQAEAALSLAMRPAENVPVYVMLPLDTVNSDGVFRYAYVPWFSQALQVLALSGVHGVAVDVWWGAIERSPGVYSWNGYKQLFEVVRAVGLKLQVVLSFHACGGNVGDMAQVPLPPWVLQAGLADPDIFFTDRPRESGLGQRNKEYISIWADDCAVLPAAQRQHQHSSSSSSMTPAGQGFSTPSRGAAGSAGAPAGGFAAVSPSGSFASLRQAAAAAAAGGGGISSSSSGGCGMRTPLQCYAEFMAAFRDEFAGQLGCLIEEVVVGSGPCGELRYPSYVEANGWRFPGVGEFQCYDRRALASLAAAAEAAGHPEWGYTGPHNSGCYNSLPVDTDFFKPHGGSWDTDYGSFFLSWYSSCLLHHGDRLLRLANQVFEPFRPKLQTGLLTQAQAMLKQLRQQQQHGLGSNGSSVGSSTDWAVAAAAAAAAVAAVGAAGGCTTAAAGRVQAGTQQAQALLQQLQAVCSSCTTAAAAVATASGAAVSHNSSSSFPDRSNLLPTATAAAAAEQTVPAAQPAAQLPAPNSSCAAPPALQNGTTAAAAAAAAGGPVGRLPSDAVVFEQASSLMQQLLQLGPSGSSSNSSSSRGQLGGRSAAARLQLSPTFATVVAAAATAAATDCLAAFTAAGIAVAGSSSSSSPTSSSTVTSPVAAGVSPRLAHSAASAPAATVAGCGVSGPFAVPSSSISECAVGSTAASSSTNHHHPSSSSMPTTASSLQSSSSTVDLSTSDLLSASQQHLATLSLHSSSRESDLSQGGGSSSPMQPSPPAAAAAAAAAAAVGSRPGVSQLLQASPPAAAATAVRQAAAVDAATEALAAVHWNGSAATATAAAAAAAAAAAGSNGLVPGSNSCSSDMSCLTILGSVGTSSTAAASPAAAAVPAPVLQLFLQLLSSLAPAAPQQQMRPQQPSQQQQQQQRKPLVLSLKIAGVHWWYNSTSHASELTAGYYNTDSRDGYSPILELCERYNVNLTITCVEMCDAQHPSYALCGPEGLLRQIRAMAAQRQVTLSGENALPIFTASGIDATALDRVVTNVRACPVTSLRSCSSWPGPGPSNAGGSSSSYGQHQQYGGSGGGWNTHQQQQHYQQQHQQQPLSLHSMGSGGVSSAYVDSIQRQHSGGWPPTPHQQQQQRLLQQQHHQQQRLLQQQHHQQQLLWYGADRMGGHQHTRRHITSNSRNFSELGTLLQVYGSSGGSSGGSGGGCTLPAGAGGPIGGVYCGGFWQRSSDSSILGGGRSSSPNADGSNGGYQQQQQQQRRLGDKGVTGGGGNNGGSSEDQLLPAMRAFTFLRLGPEILQPECHTSWMRFMHRMLNERA